jgi:hypothetical protein
MGKDNQEKMKCKQRKMDFIQNNTNTLYEFGLNIFLSII